MASGSGTNLQALIDSPQIRPHLTCVISDNPGAGALGRGRAAGLDVSVVRWADFSSREDFSNAVVDVVEVAGCDLMVLAGFMRILSPSAVQRFSGRIINVHPSLLPAFPGVDAVRQALDHGVKVTGVTVHLVDEGVDTGPIIAQRAVLVESGDDATTLHARIKIEEHQLLPEVVLHLIGQPAPAEHR